MKNYFLLLILMLTTLLNAQVGIGTSNPSVSSALDVHSSSRGFLLPRMTFTQRNSISDPVAGLMVWCNNCGVFGELQVYNGAVWLNMTGGSALEPISLSIGDNYGGGKVAYILQPGDPGFVAGQTHGLISATTDLTTGSGAPWGCQGTDLPGAQETILGTGYQNTTEIVNACTTTGIAARLCMDFVSGDYSDWYLPSINELNKLYLNRSIIGGFANDSYWSSSETGPLTAWVQNFNNGNQTMGVQKIAQVRVRAVRGF